jgi:AbrB family looped-hinge helix DNA binding protein
LAMVIAILNGMRVTIDKAGRIVVPKTVRERFGLHAGAEVEIEETGSGIVLSPVESEPALVRQDGMLVYTGKIPPGIDHTKLVENDREERIRELGGW